MVHLTRLNHQDVLVNATHIVLVEATPDTLVTLFSGEKLLVRESPHDVAAQLVSFYRRIGHGQVSAPPILRNVTDTPED
jgi:flagellar protein FlbD